ncbi:hypothetical protein DSECCO2_576040 [anaerobic digester metagenome]
MIVQSDENNVYLLPAVPDAWKSGSLRGIPTRAGVEILGVGWETNDGKRHVYVFYFAHRDGDVTFRLGKKKVVKHVSCGDLEEIHFN